MLGEGIGSSDIARAFVHLQSNCRRHSRGRGHETYSCWDLPIDREHLTPALVERLVARYHRPYHRRLAGLIGLGLALGSIAMTWPLMAPNVRLDPGVEPPQTCLGNADCT